MEPSCGILPGRCGYQPCKTMADWINEQERVVIAGVSVPLTSKKTKIALKIDQIEYSPIHKIESYYQVHLVTYDS